MTEPIPVWEGLSDEDRLRLGLVIGPPPRRTLEQVAADTGADPEELRILGTVRNVGDYERATAEIAELRRMRADEAAQAIRDHIRGDG